MSELKTKVTNASVSDFIDSIEDPIRREDSRELLGIFAEATDEKPKMWGPSIIGYGMYHYKSDRSKQEGDWMMTGFSPRKNYLAIYIIPGFREYPAELAKLGKYTTSVSCLYIKKLADVDKNVLKQMIASSFKTMQEKYPVA